MKKILLLAALSFVLFPLALVGETWITVFDHPHSNNEVIAYNIPANIFNMTVLQFRYFAMDGRSAVLSPYLTNQTLQDHINQSWSYTGFESDYYKRISVDTGNYTTSLFLGNDHDINGGGTQLARPGTPFGLFTLGYNTSASFIDAGTATYYSGFGNVIYRLDISVTTVPEPSTMLFFVLAIVLVWGKKRF